MILVYIEVVMRCILIFISIALFSCAGLQKHPQSSKLSYGGAFGLGQSSMSLSPHVFVDTPVVTVVESDSVKRALRDSLKYFPLVVDSVVADSLQNGADKEYAAAAKKMVQYRKFKKNLKYYELIYGLIATPLAIVLIFMLQSVIAGASIASLIFVITVMVLLALVWALGFLIIALIPKWILKGAKKHVNRAPEIAPSNRRIEYEVRTLLMLKNFLSYYAIQKRIEKIQNLSITEPNNPWLKKLEPIKASIENKTNAGEDINVLQIISGVFVLKVLQALIWP